MAVVASSVQQVLAAPAIQVLGFSFQTDLDKLSLLTSWRFFDMVQSVVDLRDACTAAAQKSSTAAGLALQLKTWTGLTLDKAMQ